jgi:hypothetical protein
MFRTRTGLAACANVLRRARCALPPPDIVSTAPDALREPGQMLPFLPFGAKPEIKSGNCPDSTQ